jgi:hypothetical protein
VTWLRNLWGRFRCWRGGHQITSTTYDEFNANGMNFRCVRCQKRWRKAEDTLRRR